MITITITVTIILWAFARKSRFTIVESDSIFVKITYDYPHYLRDGLLENWVILERLKKRFNAGHWILDSGCSMLDAGS